MKTPPSPKASQANKTAQAPLFDEKAIRVTVPVSPRVLEAFRRLGAASGASTGKAMGSWLEDTLEGAEAMAETLERARSAPRSVAREMHAYALGLADLTHDLIDRVGKRGRGQGAATESLGAGPHPDPGPPTPPFSNTGGKVPAKRKKSG